MNAQVNDKITKAINLLPFGINPVLMSPILRLISLNLSTLPVSNQPLKIGDSEIQWAAGFLPALANYPFGLTSGQVGDQLTYGMMADSGHLTRPQEFMDILVDLHKEFMRLGDSMTLDKQLKHDRGHRLAKL